MRDAGKNLNDTKDAKLPDPKAPADQQKQDAADRASKLDKATEQQQVSEQKLQAAMDKLGDFSTLGDMIARLEDIKAKQQDIGKRFNQNAKDNLGKKPEDMNKQDREENQQLSKEQNDLQKQTKKMLDDLDKKAQDMKKSDAGKSQAMQEASKSGSQVPQQQQQNAQSMEQNQQAQAQQAQKQVELGLEMILQKLKDAERRELEQLRKQLAELQQLVADLIRRQAGHNLDNLSVSDPKKLADMTKDLREELFAWAERDAANPQAAPGANELSPAQETTERNTRDVAQTAEKLPNPAPATKLTAAAGHMERAIVHLRASKLAEAYDPPQVEALKTLMEALEIVQKDLNEAEDKLQEQDKETVRQAYVKLLEDQKKLDAETKEIHAKRDAQGNLPRELGVIRLGQLPGVQGGLAERAEAIGKDLKTLKSIVYDWANREIGKSMEDVKQQLGNRETGEVTQAQQTKIEEQIKSLIDNLKQSPPKKSKFAGRPPGGDSQPGQGKPRPPTMPTEAELRLLKEFQQAVNKSTKTIDAAGKKEAKETLALGGRQGELRDLFGELVKQSSQGKLQLGPEPDNKDQLPEEAPAEAVDNQELDQELLGDGKQEPEADAVVEKVKKAGSRMARSRQRLALNNDPGKVTQIIQDRIVFDLDELIKESNRQQQQQQAQAKGRGSGQPKPGQARQPKPGEQQGSQQANANGQRKPGDPKEGGQAGAQSDPKNLEGAPPAEDTSKDIRETDGEWGKLFGRRREAVLEGGGQKAPGKYKQYVDDYYRSLSEKARER
jgi:hypothetical protein